MIPQSAPIINALSAMQHSMALNFIGKDKSLSREKILEKIKNKEAEYLKALDADKEFQHLKLLKDELRRLKDQLPANADKNDAVNL